MTLDLSSISLNEFVVLLVAIATVDVLAGILSAIATHTFDPAKLPDFLVSHVLQRIFPIAGLLFISQALPAGTAQGAHQAIWALALAGLVGYVVETVLSLQASLNPPKVTGLTVTSSGPKAQ